MMNQKNMEDEDNEAAACLNQWKWAIVVGGREWNCGSTSVGVTIGSHHATGDWSGMGRRAGAG